MSLSSPQTDSASLLHASPKAWRLAYFVSHPIQYQAPLLRRIAESPDFDFKTYFFSDFSLRSYMDEGFGVAVTWDIPLTEGYDHEVLPALRNKGGLSFADPLCRGILKRLEEGNFDAIWLHGYHTLNQLHVLMAAKTLRIPVFLRAESTLIDRSRSKATLASKAVFFELLSSTVAGILTVSKANAAYWQKYLPNTPQFPMPYAVDNDFFRERTLEAAPQREELRLSLGLEPNRPVILFASKLQERKRCIDLVEAHLKVCAQKASTERPYLLIVGDGEERAAIETRIQSAHASGDIRMLGFQNQTELPRYFDLCNVFVLPSVHEPYGLIVNEVMNAGRAVIVSDEVGCRDDLIEHGVSGMVFKATDIDALAGAIRYTLDTPERMESMGKKAQEHIEQYNFERDVVGLRSALAALCPKA